MALTSIGSLVKTVRLNLQLSQEQFATLLGVEQASVSRWETGKLSPSFLQLQSVFKLAAQEGQRSLFDLKFSCLLDDRDEVA